MSEQYQEDLRDIAQKHLQEEFCKATLRLSSSDFQLMVPTQILEALKVVRRWVKRTYHDVNCGILELICTEINNYFDFKVKFEHGYFSLSDDKDSFSQPICDLDSGYVSNVSNSVGKMFHHPRPYSELQDLILTLEKDIEVLVLGYSNLLDANPSSVPVDWEVHTFEGFCPVDLGFVISNIRGMKPKKLILDVEPQILELRNHGFDELQHSLCTIPDTTVFVTKFRILDSMSSKLRQSLNLQNELLSDFFENLIPCGDYSSNNIQYWSNYIEQFV